MVVQQVNCWFMAILIDADMINELIEKDYKSFRNYATL